MNLIKMFPKRFKYTDWDFPVKSAIRRKVGDFSIKHARYSSKHIYENQCQSNDDNDEFSENSFLNFHFQKKESKTESVEKITELTDYIQYLYKKMNEDLRNIFNDWDREFVEVILELHVYNNEIELNEIKECMGYDKNQRPKFMSKVNALQLKFKKCIEGEALCRL